MKVMKEVFKVLYLSQLMHINYALYIIHA